MTINYTHKSSMSFKAAMIKNYMKLFGFKKDFDKRMKFKTFKTEPDAIPQKPFEELNINTSQTQNRTVYEISSKTSNSSQYVFYLHGGAYVNNITTHHWNFIAELVTQTGVTAIVPDYPLAPDATAKAGFAMVEKVYKNLLEKVSSDKIILMGDSAGGGFSLALAQKFKTENTPLPQQLILFSPFLDVSMVNPDIKVIEKKDPWLSIDGSQIAGKFWAGDFDTQNPLISPIYGSMAGLPQISVFIGGRDILSADNDKLRAFMDKNKFPFNYFKYPEMFHVWVLLTKLKEAQSAMKQIVKLIVG